MNQTDCPLDAVAISEKIWRARGLEPTFPAEGPTPTQLRDGPSARSGHNSSFSNAGAEGSHDPEASDADTIRHALPILASWAVAARSRARSACRHFNPCSNGCARARTANDTPTHYEDKSDGANHRWPCNRRSQVVRVHEKTPVHGKPLSAAETIARRAH